MKYKYSSRRDDLLFVVALLVPAIFAGARYFESDRQMTQIVQAQGKKESVVGTSPERARVRVAEVERPRR